MAEPSAIRAAIAVAVASVRDHDRPPTIFQASLARSARAERRRDLAGPLARLA